MSKYISLPVFLFFYFVLFHSFGMAAEISQNNISHNANVSAELDEGTAFEGDFLGYIWGVTPEDVRQLEYRSGTPFLQEVENALFYQEEFKGKKSSISYEFKDNKLWRGQIEVFERTAEPQDWLDLLMEIQIEYDKKYGKSSEEDFIWSNARYKDHPQDWRYALFEGHLQINVEWIKDKTLIIVNLKTIEPFRPALKIIHQEIQGSNKQEPEGLNLIEKESNAQTEPLIP